MDGFHEFVQLSGCQQSSAAAACQRCIVSQVPRVGVTAPLPGDSVPLLGTIHWAPAGLASHTEGLKLHTVGGGGGSAARAAPRSPPPG